MSVHGFAGPAMAKYFTMLNTGAATRLIRAGWKAGMPKVAGMGAAYGPFAGRAAEYAGRMGGAAMGAGRWMMGGGTAGRIARIGTAAGAGVGAVGAARTAGGWWDDYRTYRRNRLLDRVLNPDLTR
jgi:hypothetical protein